MTVLEQCQAWHEQDKHNAIVNTLEALPDSQRTAETDMELARAYNNLADPGKVNARDLLWRAIHRMEPPPQPAAGYVQLEFPDGLRLLLPRHGGTRRGRISNGLWPCIPGTTPASTPSASCGR